MKNYYSIAIDGPSGAGKSSQAKALAKAFGLIYVDTGAIYRTVALATIRAGIEPKNEKKVLNILPTMEISMRYDEQGTQCMLLNGEDVSQAIRMPDVSTAASDVAAHPGVRGFLLDMQRKLARENHVVMDGRDIGTVVLPNASLKIFLTASAESRAKRRLLELQEKGVAVSYEEVLAGIRYRDEQDSSRAAAPLIQAEDACLVDCSETDFHETGRVLRTLVETKLGLRPEGDR